VNTSISISEDLAPISGGTLYVKSWSPTSTEANDRYPLLLFHDSIGCVDMWRQFPLALASKLQRRVIAYDRLGYGRSSARRDLPSARFISEEAEVYFPVVKARLGIREFATFGHSVGGGMAVVIASKYPQECQAVVTEAAQAFVEQRTLTSIAEAKIWFADPAELAKLARHHGDKASWVVRAWTETWLSAEFSDWNLRSELPAVKCPLLAIHGDRDEYGSMAFPEVLSSMTAGYAEKMILSNCGHVPHREQEEPVLEKTRKFLSEAVGRHCGVHARTE